MKLRVTGPGINQVITLKQDATVNDLIEHVGIDVKTLRFGYPPQRINVQEDDAALRETQLDELGINSGEKIVLETSQSKERSSMPPPQPKPKRVLKSTEMSIGGSREDVLSVHSVPDDNSCLFHAIAYNIFKQDNVRALREMVSKEISQNPIKFNDAILDKPNKEYAQWILRMESWGGAIEIGIISDALAVAIYVVDIDAVKIEKFNDEKFDNFILILFNGIHYDSLTMNGFKTVFDSKNQPESDNVLTAALQLASNLKQTGYSFNTHKAQIKCNICQMTFVGEREVARHAESTGHVDFGQNK
ncbi:yod1p [Saccharomyces arboricola H-6]|uniref:Ubiquitin thioesterase OTU n=1 Tax=Saccharomyces arboricola (strain H-6 / AS 2.3317 / CBS 10644) TaxID=1160507 RepID=J8Q5K8_SACAR|nr:yod1p [Saccharomyces arboricola H-6]